MSSSQESVDSPALAFIKKMKQFGATSYTLGFGRYQGRERVVTLHICSFPDGTRQALEFRRTHDSRYGGVDLEPTRKHFHEEQFMAYQAHEQLTLHIPLKIEVAIKKSGRPELIRAHLAQQLLPKRRKEFVTSAA